MLKYVCCCMTILLLFSCSDNRKDERENSGVNEDEEGAMKQPVREIGCDSFNDVPADQVKEADITQTDRQRRELLGQYENSSWEGELSCPEQEEMAVRIDFASFEDEMYYLYPDDNIYEDMKGYYVYCKYIATLETTLSISSFEIEDGTVIDIDNFSIKMEIKRDADSPTVVFGKGYTKIENPEWEILYWGFTIEQNDIPQIKIELESGEEFEGDDVTVHGMFCTINNWVKI